MVAARAGVSSATVSLVANGKTEGRVSADKITRVSQAIEELGYVVDGIGSSLARGGSNLVILVAPDLANPFFAKVIAGVRTALGGDYQLLLAVSEPGQLPTPEEVRALMSLRPAGLLVDAPDAAFLDRLHSTAPVVLLDAPGVGGYAPSVNLDVGHGARELAKHLARLGHVRVAYLDSTSGTATFRVRREAFLDQAAASGIQVPDGAIASTPIDVGAAAAAFAGSWAAWQHNGVTAVVCCTDTHAYGVLQEARVAGIGVPERLAVAGFDDLPYSATSSPALTSVHLPAAALGEQAGWALKELMRGGVLTEPLRTLASTLIERASTTGQADRT
ncbi:LacI family DNA-binding transcriptional regulator [Arthrobacter sp. UYEF3]|uniref:LacI family DNA-binding transcriptional regulator n=1 Tax=Arthrobacter sp. UYEF3 TaxID=1756365 RepID=UPI003394DF78